MAMIRSLVKYRVNRYQGVDLVRLYKVLSLRAMRIVRHYGGLDTF